MSGDVCGDLDVAKSCIELGLYDAAIAAILRAEKAWQVEVEFWAIQLFEAEKAAK